MRVTGVVMEEAGGSLDGLQEADGGTVLRMCGKGTILNKQRQPAGGAARNH